MMGALVLQILKTYFNNAYLQWYLKNNIVFVQTNDQHIKMQCFMKKKELLELINGKLGKTGVTVKVKDIITR